VKFQAFVINLDSRPDRLAEFRRRTRRFSLPVERFSALTPQQLVDRGVAAEVMPWEACNASHAAICEVVLDRDLDWALVFEDDVLPIIGFERRVRWALDAAPPDAWLVQLGHIGTAGSPTRRILRSLGGHAVRSMNIQRREQYWWGSQAYLVSKQFATFMIEHPVNFHGPDNHRDVHMGRDNTMRELSLETKFKDHCFVHHPNLAGQSVSTSDLGKDPILSSEEPHGLKEWRRFLL
jgi:GR25 family glycosyltransferase involved in LPS biosynthesis